ncbi:hypothetical protein HK102_013100 [Quaeritorhiza haematococci]|nr:hypothetical protein HK102_013100 [Quaeritorhiza haematococci]
MQLAAASVRLFRMGSGVQPKDSLQVRVHSMPDIIDRDQIKRDLSVALAPVRPDVLFIDVAGEEQTVGPYTEQDEKLKDDLEAIWKIMEPQTALQVFQLTSIAIDAAEESDTDFNFQKWCTDLVARELLPVELEFKRHYNSIWDQLLFQWDAVNSKTPADVQKWVADNHPESDVFVFDQHQLTLEDFQSVLAAKIASEVEALLKGHPEAVKGVEFVEALKAILGDAITSSMNFMNRFLAIQKQYIRKVVSVIRTMIGTKHDTVANPLNLLQ